jgi:hypothetical protein
VSGPKPTICIDFDSIINPYSKGWQDGALYETHIVPEFFTWCEAAGKRFRLVVYSPRSRTPAGLSAMRAWVECCALNAGYNLPGHQILAAGGTYYLSAISGRDFVLEFAHDKPAAFLTIDDRAIQFRGDWAAPELTMDAMEAFKPWNAR